jgi:hypothetical protein
LAESLKKEAILIHISCHGETFERLQAKVGESAFNSYQNFGDFLLFEDELGMG